MNPAEKSPADLRVQENQLYKALKAWYVTAGIQRDLRHKENEAVQTVLEILDRRRNAKMAKPSTE